MHKQLILKVFEKAKNLLEKSKGTSISISAVATYLSILLEDKRIPYSDRSIRKNYNQALEGENENDIIKQADVINAFCNYLGYDNYKEFCEAIQNDDTDNEINDISIVDNEITIQEAKITPSEETNTGDSKKKIWGLGILCLALITTIVIITLNKQRWMIWNETEYIEVKFDPKKYKLNQLKLYNEDRIKNFKKVKPDSTYLFFDVDNSVNLWYGKNQKKELEYFTFHGLHPETGKTLNPITTYMIKKHILKIKPTE